MYVYFIKTETRPGYLNELVKIGKSNDPYGRLNALQIGSPVKLRMLAIVQCESDERAYKIEKLAHELFERQHKRGEWFLLGGRRERMLKRLSKKVAMAATQAPAREKEHEVTDGELPKMQPADQFHQAI